MKKNGKLLNENSGQEIEFRGKGTGIFIEKKGKGYIFTHNGEDLTGSTYSYIDNVMNANGIVMTKGMNGSKKLVHISDYMPEEGDVEESRYMRESRKSKRRVMLENRLRAVIRPIVRSILNEGKKQYYTMNNVGSSKYTLNFHDGVKKNKDGSDFWDIRIFKNKTDLAKAMVQLGKQGYTEGRP